MTNYKICLLPGDGIGPEVTTSARDVLAVLPIQWDFIECGMDRVGRRLAYKSRDWRIRTTGEK